MTRPLTRRRRAAVAAARAAVGTPFRPQGRAPGLGLDCIGVVLLAAQGADVLLPPLPAYAMSGDHGDTLIEALMALGCRPVPAARPGDLIVAEPAPGRRHLAVASESGIIHAHAGLGRVVEGPLPTDWTLIGAWRLPGLR